MRQVFCFGGESRFSLRLGHGAALTPHCGVIHPALGSPPPAQFYKRKQGISDALFSLLCKNAKSVPKHRKNAEKYTRGMRPVTCKTVL
jgi:hypothetical protein